MIPERKVLYLVLFYILLATLAGSTDGKGVVI